MGCHNCDGQPFIVDRDVAEALAALRGPRRRDNSRANQYGGKGILKYNPTNAETNIGIRANVTLVDWQSADGDPRTMTVEIGRIASGGGGSFPQPAEGADLLAYRALAQVVIGTPSAMEDVFFIDVARGQRFTVAASYVAVSAIMPAPPTGYISGSLAVVGNIGYGTAPSLSPVIYTQYLDGLANDTSETFVIPSKANFLLPVRCSNVANTIRLNILDASGTQIDQLQFTSGAMIIPAVLAGDAHFIQVRNTGATANFRLVYQLSV